jgi:hypothetical protein
VVPLMDRLHLLLSMRIWLVASCQAVFLTAIEKRLRLKPVEK